MLYRKIIRPILFKTDPERIHHFVINFLGATSVLRPFYFLIKIIFPQLSTKEPESLIYFKHIDVKYKFNKKQGISDFINFDEDKFKKDIINQILSLSFVSSSKYKLLQKGFFFFGLEVLFILILRYI